MCCIRVVGCYILVLFLFDQAPSPSLAYQHLSFLLVLAAQIPPEDDYQHILLFMQSHHHR
jgi:hypothetical protein